MNAEPRFTAIDVARHLGVVQDTVDRWRERKGLPARTKSANGETPAVRGR